MGPIPLPWLERAMVLPGRAVHVAIQIWFLAGLTKSCTVRLGLSDLAGGKINRTTAGRGLAALERAGLVTVVRAPGCKPMVTLMDAPMDTSVSAIITTTTNTNTDTNTTNPATAAAAVQKPNSNQ